MIGINGLNSTYYNKAQNFNASRAPKTSFSLGTSDANIVLDSKALFSWADGKGRGNISVYKDDTYTNETPLLLVKGVDLDGNPFETKINPKSVNPSNASNVEMAALTAYLTERKELTTIDSSMFSWKSSGGHDSSESYFTKHNFLSSIQSIADMQLANRNMGCYAILSSIKSALLKYSK